MGAPLTGHWIRMEYSPIIRAGLRSNLTFATTEFMAAFKNTAFMAASTAVRLSLGLVTFAALARLLGPASFGVFMFCMAIATLTSLPSNYGFTPFLLRKIGRRPREANRVMREVLTAKLLMSGVLGLIAATALLVTQHPESLTLLLLTLAMLIDSMTDFLNVGYRATNRFGSETRIATIAAFLQFTIVVGGTWYAPTPVSAATAFLLSRVLALLITWKDQHAFFSELKPTSLRQAIGTLKKAIHYAYDFILQSLFGQVDSLVLIHFLGPVAVGLHQAGMRLFQGGAQIASILGNVFIPRLSNAHKVQSISFAEQANKLQTAFIVSGALFGLTLALAAQPIVHILFGREYEALIPLLPWFGLLFLVRFLGSSYGIILTSIGRQGFRARINFLSWCVILGAAWLLVPAWGNVGWLAALVAGNALLVVIYGIATLDTVKPKLDSLALASGSLAVFPLLLTIPK